MDSMNLPLEIAYLASSVLFILGAEGAEFAGHGAAGHVPAEIGMVMAVIGTLCCGNHIITWEWIIARVAHRLGRRRAHGHLHAHDRHAAANRPFALLRRLAAVLVGVAEYHLHSRLRQTATGLMSRLGL